MIKTKLGVSKLARRETRQQRNIYWEVCLAFFLGAAISSIAQDPSDVIFFYAQSHNMLGGSGSTFFWYWVPFLLYGSFFLIGYLFSKLSNVSPTFIFIMYAAAVGISTIYSFFLPQAKSAFFEGTVILATIVSAGIITDMVMKTSKRY